MGLQWADIGEVLGLTVPEMRALRATFGGVLGLGPDNRLREDLVPVIAFIHRSRQRGISAEEIERQLRETCVDDKWPEEVLARMQAAPAATLAMPAELIVKAPPAYEPIMADFLSANQSPVPVLDRDLTTESGSPDGSLSVSSSPDSPLPAQVSSEPSALQPPDQESRPRNVDMVDMTDLESILGTSLYVAKPAEMPEATVREMVTDLRREICTQTVEERELMYKMNQLLQNLILEVRDLRYAFLLASSRKDRKRGKRGIGRLLSQ